MKLQIEFLVPRRPQHCLRGILEHPQDHRSGGDADADVVFDDVPFAAALHGGDLRSGR